mmetsp:Transcript_49576/g.97659  ORF Transcript_49576/g.97659 Transcript_49576/m.97659 type:complete len:84 (-) Transcript_49576:752-1003(-)
MGTTSSSPASTPGASPGVSIVQSVKIDHSKCENKPKEMKRPCCVCRETRTARDECILLNGEEKCKDFVEAHNRCLKAEGFDPA